VSAWVGAISVKGVLTRPLSGNNEDAEAELDTLVRRAFTKGPKVQEDDGLYFRPASETDLLGQLSGIQQRNIGLDFIWFARAWEWAGTLPMAVPRSWILKSELALEADDYKSVAKTIRTRLGTSWCVGIRLVSIWVTWLNHFNANDDQFDKGSPTGRYIFRTGPPSEAGGRLEKIGVTLNAVDQDLEKVTVCETCMLIGKTGHTRKECPRITSINKIRENLGYPPLSWNDQTSDWSRTDVKATKSAEDRLTKLETDLNNLRSKVGQLESQIKGSKRKRSEEEEKEEPEKKKQKGGKAEKAPADAPKEEKGKKGKKRGGKKGKKAENSKEQK
jgi:hypothetical protein